MATNGKALTPRTYRPLSEPTSLQQVMREMMDLRWPFGPARSLIADVPDPAIDMFERNGNVVVKAEMPGIDPAKIEVTVSGGELRISGERSEEKEVREEDFYRSERRYGRIFRTVTLPEGCNADAVTATSKDGVVEIVVPRKPAASTKKIEVKSK
jgi:HSP20 family protein